MWAIAHNEERKEEGERGGEKGGQGEAGGEEAANKEAKKPPAPKGKEDCQRFGFAKAWRRPSPSGCGAQGTAEARR